MRRSVGLLLMVVMVMTAACATVPPPPPAVNVSGIWVGTWRVFEGDQGGGDLRGTFLQEGAAVKGEFLVTGRVMNTTFVSGSMSGNQITLSVPAPGTLVVEGDRMTGTINGVAATQVILRRQQ